MTTPNEPVEGGWIEWAGGECPVTPGAIVDVRCRDNYEARNTASSFCEDENDGHDWWSHTQPEGEGRRGRERAEDIIAYRVVNP